VVMDRRPPAPPESLPELLAPRSAAKPTSSSAPATRRAARRRAVGVLCAGSTRGSRRCSPGPSRAARAPTQCPASSPSGATSSTPPSALTPLGYKIGLELLCKCGARARSSRCRSISAPERRGRSKLTLAQQFKYLEHLSRLYDFTFPRLSPAVKFSRRDRRRLVGGADLFLTLSRRGMGPMPAATLSYPAAIVATAAFHMRYVRTQRNFLVSGRPWRDFIVTCLCEWAACAAWRDVESPNRSVRSTRWRSSPHLRRRDGNAVRAAKETVAGRSRAAGGAADDAASYRGARHFRRARVRSPSQGPLNVACGTGDPPVSLSLKEETWARSPMPTFARRLGGTIIPANARRAR
jgi:hypothetical protein